MPAERFYIQDPSFTLKKLIILEKEEFHHLMNVMRLKVGERVELINGTGALAEAAIESINKKNAILSIESIHIEPVSSYQLILAQALPRLPRLEYILEKSVELGVTDLWLFPGTFSEKKDLSPSQLERIHHIIVSAMKQCGRLYIPKVSFRPSLLSWTLKEIPSHAFFGDTRPNAPTFLQELLSLDSQSLFIVIGPEKGFQEKEVFFMEKNLHLKGVKLHENILRTETAAIHALSLASSFKEILQQRKPEARYS